MSTTAKRPLDLGSVSTGSSESAGSSRSEDGSQSPGAGEEPRKKGGKPGRKPLDDEAKNKRTAQNRAAQRAFRERKERKMKELEDKVRDLEKINQQSAVEAEFLRSQLMTLVSELKKYRPTDATDSQVLAYLSKSDSARGGSEMEESVKKKMDFTFAFPWKDKNGAKEQFPSPGSSSSTSISMIKRKASGISPNGVDPVPENINNTPSSSTTGSGWMDNVFYSDDAQKLPQFAANSSINDPLGEDSVLFSNHFNFDDEFDEQVSQFCAKMNQACGTKDSPVPKQTPKRTPVNLSNTWEPHLSTISPSENEIEGGNDKNSIPSIPSSISSASTSNEKPPILLDNIPINDYIIETNNAKTKLKGHQKLQLQLQQQRQQQLPVNQEEAQANADTLPFLDTSLAFPSENDQSLIFRTTQDDNLFAELLDDNEISRSNAFEENLINEEPLVTATVGLPMESDVVPARDGKLLKCSEVWDRITSHPKYTSLDIDGLCVELMAKAKCSEKGVVLQAEHVQRALDKQASLKDE